MLSPMWVIMFGRIALYTIEINQNTFVYIGDFTFEIRAWAVRHVSEHVGTHA